MAAAVEHLHRRGLKVAWQDIAEPDVTADGLLDVRWEGGSHSFPVVAKTRLTASTVPLLRRTGAELVLTDHVSRDLGTALSDAGLSYADASGNASLTAPGLLVRIEGRRTAGRPSPSPELPFSATGLPITFALLVLSPRDRRPTQRELSELTGSSLGSTNRVMQALRRLTYVSEDGTVLRREPLIDRWTESYLYHRDELAPELSFTSDRWTSPADLLHSLPEAAYVSSELAAHVQGLSIRPETALVYAWPEARQELVRAGRLRPGEHGWVHVRQPFWRPELLCADEQLPQFLVRADLLAEQDPRLTSIATAQWPEHREGRAVDVGH